MNIGLKKTKITLIFYIIIFLLYNFGITNCTKNESEINLPTSIPFKHFINGVPFIKQKPYYCAPASAEMVLKYYGITKFTQDIIASCDSLNKKGTHWKMLFEYLIFHGKNNGFETKKKDGNLTLLKKYIASNYPIIVRQWTNLSKKNRHYRVVVGYDDEKNEIICNDPLYGQNYNIQYDIFRELWEINHKKSRWSSHNLMIIIIKN